MCGVKLLESDDGCDLYGLNLAPHTVCTTVKKQKMVSFLNSLTARGTFIINNTVHSTYDAVVPWYGNHASAAFDISQDVPVQCL